MSTHKQLEKKETFYSITFTCYRWLPLIDESELYDHIPIWFHNLKDKHCLINAYCIMPNHIHLICFPTESCKSINHVIGEAKRFLAYEIVKRLKQLEKYDLLEILANGVTANEEKKSKKHQIFRLSFDAKEVNFDSMHNLMSYIHQNPTQGVWSLVEDYTEYDYSSAGYYERGAEKPVFLTDYRDIWEES